MKLRTRLLVGYVVIFGLMIFSAWVTYQNTNNFIEDGTWVDHTYEVEINARLIEKLLVDMETGVRGYALTGQDNFLEPYNSASSSCNLRLTELKELVSDNPSQVKATGEIEALVARWQKEAALPLIQLRRDVVEGAAGADMANVIAFAQQGTGKTLMDAIRGSIDKFVDVEDVLMKQRKKETDTAAARSIGVVIFGTILAIALGIGAMLLTTRAILGQVGGEPAEIAGIADQIASGHLDADLVGDPRSATGIQAAIGQMLLSLRENRDQTVRQDWLKTGVARFSEVMRGESDIETLASKVISEVATYLDAQVGVFYLAQHGETPTFSLLGSYAYAKRKNLSNVFKSGEGLVGQAALEKQQILLKNVPEDYVKVISGLGERVPRFICVTPFLHEGHVKGVIEIGTLNEMRDRELEYLSQIMPALAIAVHGAENQSALAKAFEESQQLTNDLQAQQEELRVANEELEDQAHKLKESEEELKVQQEELQVTNEELEEKNDLLERQKREVESARKDIQEKAEEVALASKYKSEFLANMSHELRTPLNSLLLLAQGLTQNKEGNLTADQIESARIIHGGGSDLLNLINEILDLSKIEAGRMDLHIGAVSVSDLADNVRASFQHMAEEKGLGLKIAVRGEAPEQIVSDRQRVEQVIKNLISNAIKFTDAGSVTVSFGQPAPGTNLSRSGLSAGECLAIAVEDTGIGITPEQQKIVFEAFQQADGGTSRRYGGTGLGLSISRGLARLLGGEIRLESEWGKGSTFTLYLPIALSADRKVPAETFGASKVSRTDSDAPRDVAPERVEALQIKDDREILVKDDRVILVIEDDPTFAGLLHKKCNEKGFRCLASPTGEAGLDLARKHLPSAVILDIRLPGMDGWAVLAALKEDTRTRHIPVHIISAGEASTEALRKGAIGYAVKPLAQEDLEEAFLRITEVSAGKPKRVLVVEDNEEIRSRTVMLIGGGDVQVDEAVSGEQALEALRANRYDCVVLDLGLPAMNGGELLEKLEREGVELPPVIIHTARDLTRDEELNLRGHAKSIVIKDVRSPERLLDEVSLFLHRVVSKMPEEKRQVIRDLHDTDAHLKDKKVLIVDDDMRTTFAMSRLLDERGMKPVKAENGERALQALDREPDIDLVLMDIMMPIMDGFEAIAKIRAQERFRKLPIIVLTAKAMPQDREKCFTAGANDYLPKPVDAGRLISMMRVWLCR